ncbi:unnamed protein product, partial [Brenthis ino]
MQVKEMVVDQFPMFRLATLLARQMSSPLAARIKRYAVSHPRFGAAICINVAEIFHACEWRARSLSLRLAGVGLSARTRPPPLPRRTAVDLGGDLLVFSEGIFPYTGEIIIFTLGSCIVIFEVNRQGTNKNLKELDEKSQWLAISLSLEELRREVAVQQADISRLRDALLSYEPQSPVPGDDGGHPAPSHKLVQE